EAGDDENVHPDRAILDSQAMSLQPRERIECDPANRQARGPHAERRNVAQGDFHRGPGEPPGEAQRDEHESCLEMRSALHLPPVWIAALDVANAADYERRRTAKPKSRPIFCASASLIQTIAIGSRYRLMTNGPASTASNPRSAANPETILLASPSSPATNITQLPPAYRLSAMCLKPVVLNALTTRAPRASRATVSPAESV